MVKQRHFFFHVSTMYITSISNSNFAYSYYLTIRSLANFRTFLEQHNGLLIEGYIANKLQSVEKCACVFHVS